MKQAALLAILFSATIPHSARAGALTALYNFQGGADGAQPLGGLTFHHEIIYGVTVAGGAAAAGTIFGLNEADGTEAVVFGFPEGSNNGPAPNTPLAYVGGKFFITYFAGGDYGCGTAVRIDPKHSSQEVMHSFECGAFQAPNSPLLYVNGVLLGTTLGSGDQGEPGAGTIFSLDPTAGTEIVVNLLNGVVGDEPVGGLISVGDKIYGTAVGGGRGVGTIFQLNAAKGAVKLLHSFNYDHGPWAPESRLTYHNGLLYGTTQFSSKNPDEPGTVYVFDPVIRKARRLHSFNSNNGGIQPAWLTYLDGALYGTTRFGGKADCGLLYKMSPSTGKEQVLLDFPCADRVNPLFSAHGGTLYGTTAAGGLGYGTVFKYVP